MPPRRLHDEPERRLRDARSPEHDADVVGARSSTTPARESTPDRRTLNFSPPTFRKLPYRSLAVMVNSAWSPAVASSRLWPDAA
eukprot:3014156-Rhodomonas_salina.2